MSAVRYSSQSEKLVYRMMSLNYDFITKLYRKASHRNFGSNLFIAPLNITTLLASLHLCARDHTIGELENILNISSIEDSPHELYKYYISIMKAQRNKFTFATSHKLFSKQDIKFSETFNAELYKYYLAKTEQVNFRENHEALHEEMNTWVSEQTKGKIENVNTLGNLDPATHILMANTMYFKAGWALKFDKAETRKMPFFTEKDKFTMAEMMYQKNEFRCGFSEELQCSLLELPCENSSISMVLFLPCDVEGVSTLEKKLTPDVLKNLNSLLMPAKEIDVYLPKFSVRECCDLGNIFNSLGIKDLLLMHNGSVPRINEPESLNVQNVVHTTFMEITEDGLEIASSNAVSMKTKSETEKQQKICADHQFIFLIHDSRVGAILFMGRLANPVGERAMVNGYGDTSATESFEMCNSNQV